jgi:hypothetical protein
MSWTGKQEQIDDLTRQLAEANRQLDISQAAGVIAVQVGEAIAEYTTTGEADQAARDMAYTQVLASEQQSITDEIRDGLLRTKRSELRAQCVQNEGPGISKELDAQFKADGTYDRERLGVQARVREEITEELKSKAKDQAAAEIDTPENRERFKAEIRPGVADLADVENFRRTRRQELEVKWREEVEADVNRQTADEEGARETEFKAQYEQDYRQTPKFERLREQTRTDLKNKWRDATIETVNAELKDEELTAILTEKARLAKEKLDRKNRATELLHQFEGAGIDVKAIENDSKITIELGEILMEKPKSDYGGYSDRPAQPVLHRSRVIILLALGDGRFQVLGDSLTSSKSKWESMLAIDEGVVISIGNLHSENGERTLGPRIRADVPLGYDDDTTTPSKFVGTPVQVANVIIDGVSAREILERKDASKS